MTHRQAQFQRQPDDQQVALPYCFAKPHLETPIETPEDMLQHLVWRPGAAERAATMMQLFSDKTSLESRLLRGLSSREMEAIARLLAIMVCAEESAINVFQLESERMNAGQTATAQRKLLEIASEERVHDWLIQQTRQYFPVPDDLSQLRKRARRLFIRMASRDFGEHFARISGLDTGVCICLNHFLKAPRIHASQGISQLFRYIRQDESGHIKVGRQHALACGFDKASFGVEYTLSRQRLADLLDSISDSLETIGADPDILFNNLLKQKPFGV